MHCSQSGRGAHPCAPRRYTTAAALTLLAGLCAGVAPQTADAQGRSQDQDLGAAPAPAAASTAASTSSVKIFGAIDGFVESAWTGRGRILRVGSGGLSTTRWGLAADEDLGGGLKAGVLLEQTFGVDTGVLNNGGRAFGRTALVKLESTQWGRLELGRMATIYLETLAAFQMARYGSGNFLYNPGVTLTHDNTLKYTSPNWGPVTLTLRHEFGESSQSTSVGRQLGAMVQVRQDNLVVVGSYTRSNAPNDIPTLGDAVTMATLGASYRFGIFQPLALVSKVRSRVEPRSVDQTMMNLGLSITLPRSNLRFEVERLRNHALADADGQAISVRYDYHLSKRTTLYVGADKIRSEANVYYPIVGASGSSPVAAPFPASYRGADPASLIAGMLHIF